jgi:hypothetical protein
MNRRRHPARNPGGVLHEIYIEGGAKEDTSDCCGECEEEHDRLVVLTDIPNEPRLRDMISRTIGRVGSIQWLDGVVVPVSVSGLS